jgi:hypothetical protein
MDLPYYHGCLTKRECEALLLKGGVDGNFLIRDSESVPGALCLCVSWVSSSSCRRTLMAAICSGRCISFYFGIGMGQALPGEDRRMSLPSSSAGLPLSIVHATWAESETTEEGRQGRKERRWWGERTDIAAFSLRASLCDVEKVGGGGGGGFTIAWKVGWLHSLAVFKMLRFHMLSGW